MTTKLIALALCLASVCAPQASAQKKYKHKEKRFEPVARQDVRDYAGRYVGIEDDYVVEVRVGEDGRLSATSREGGRDDPRALPRGGCRAAVLGAEEV